MIHSQPQAFIGMLCLLLACCSLPPPQSPAQSVYQMKAGFLVSLKVAEHYVSLPPCPATPLCADQNIVDKVLLAAHAAKTALDAAESTVTDPAFAQQDLTPRILVAASQALSVFNAMTDNLKVQ